MDFTFRMAVIFAIAIVLIYLATRWWTQAEDREGRIIALGAGALGSLVFAAALVIVSDRIL